MIELALRGGWRWSWIGAGVVAVAMLEACVLYDDQGPTSTELYRLIDAHCGSATACGCDFARPDADACVPELEVRWKARASEAQARGLRYDAACLAGITAEVEAYGCYWPGGASPLCDRFCAVFHGDAAEGDDCSGDDVLVSDCAQGLACHEGTCVSPCAGLGGRGEGERCGDDLRGQFDDCADGLWCAWWTTGLCQRSAGPGESCSNAECATGLVCDWRNDVCVTARTEGQSCDDADCAEGLSCEWNNGASFCRSYAQEGEACSDRPCADELWCNEAERCAPAPGAGQPCLWGSICDDASTCDFTVGLCLALPGAGAPCAVGQCAAGAWCDTSVDANGLCVPPRATGEMCAGHSHCQSRYCPNGFCGEPPRLGESCVEAGACAPGLVCNGEICETTLTRAPAACSYPGW